MVGLVLTSVAFARQDPAHGLPGPILSDVRHSVVASLPDAQAGKPQLALGRLESTLFPQGVTLALDPNGADAAFRRLFVRSIAAWKEALGSDCPLRLAGPNETPQIWVRRVDTLPTGEGRELGLIQLERRVQYNRSLRRVLVSGTILVLSTHSGVPTSEAEQYHILLHEIGHLLGLDDVPEWGPLMGPLRRGQPLTTIPVAEVAMVRQLRTVLRQRTEQVSLLASMNP